MNNLKVLIFFAVFLLGTASTVYGSAIPYFSDDFNEYNSGDNAADFDFQTIEENWTVTNGTVDLIGNGTDDIISGHSLYVNMDGTSGDAGNLISRNFNLINGFYVLSFDLAGNGMLSQSSQASVTVEIDGVFTENYLLDYDAPFETYTKFFQIDNNVMPITTINISFLTADGEDSGILLDNVILDDASAVPLPGSILLLGSSLIGFIGYRKKTKK